MTQQLSSIYHESNNVYLRALDIYYDSNLKICQTIKKIDKLLNKPVYGYELATDDKQELEQQLVAILHEINIFAQTHLNNLIEKANFFNVYQDVPYEGPAIYAAAYNDLFAKLINLNASLSTITLIKKSSIKWFIMRLMHLLFRRILIGPLAVLMTILFILIHLLICSWLPLVLRYNRGSYDWYHEEMLYVKDNMPAKEIYLTIINQYKEMLLTASGNVNYLFRSQIKTLIRSLYLPLKRRYYYWLCGCKDKGIFSHFSKTNKLDPLVRKLFCVQKMKNNTKSK